MNSIFNNDNSYDVSSPSTTLRSVKETIDRGNYILDINVQRQEQRNDRDKKEFQIGIIDSIIKGFKIPPIICNIINNNDKKRVIDGAHRIRAIGDYMNNIFKYKNKLFKELSIRDQNKFKNLTIDENLYCDLDEEQESDIFIKYNNVCPLQTGDSIKALYNPIVNDWRGIISDMKRDDKYKCLPSGFQKRDNIWEIIGSLYSYLYLEDNTQGGKSLVHKISDATNKRENVVNYNRTNQHFKNCILESISIFIDCTKDIWHFKPVKNNYIIIVAMLFKHRSINVREIIADKVEQHIAYNENNVKQNNCSSKKHMDSILSIYVS